MSFSFFWYPMKRRRPVLLNTGLHTGSRPNAGALRVRRVTRAFGQTVLLTHVRRLCPSFPHLEQGILSVFVSLSLYFSAYHTPQKCTSIFIFTLQRVKNLPTPHSATHSTPHSNRPLYPFKERSTAAACAVSENSRRVAAASIRSSSAAAHAARIESESFFTAVCGANTYFWSRFLMPIPVSVTDVVKM